MCANVLNTVGLSLGIAGVVVIFFFGPPQPDLSIGVGLAVGDGTVIDKSSGKTAADHDREVLAKRRTYTKVSRFGLLLIMAGFGFQLAATWLP